MVISYKMGVCVCEGELASYLNTGVETEVINGLCRNRQCHFFKKKICAGVQLWQPAILHLGR